MHAPKESKSLAERIGDVLFEHRAFEENPLSEQALADMFGVSRTPVRDALLELEREGLVERRKKKGVYLLRPSPRDLAEVYDVRAALECHAVRVIAENADGDGLRELERIAKRFSKAREQDDAEAMDAANIAFHERIVELSGNALLAGIVSRFRIISRAFRLAHGITLKQPMPPTGASHEAIVAALRAGDVDRCEQLMRRHVLDAKRKLMEKALGVRLD